jgi:hypothetical protein
MKMRSKFLGINAKVALALLAVGSMFTSCYDTENGDATAPYVAPDAMYTIQGQVIDGITLKPVKDITITVTGVINGSGTTDAEGIYRVVDFINGGTSGSAVVSASSSNYAKVEASITIEVIPNGLSANYIKNLMMNPTDFTDSGVRVEVIPKSDTEPITVQGENPFDKDTYSPALDIVNNTNEPMWVEKIFDVQNGARIIDPATTRAATRAANLSEFASQFINTHLGQVVTTDAPPTVSETYSFLLPAKTALKSVTILYNYEDLKYTFTYGEQVEVVHVRNIISRIYSYNAVLLNMYHGHGHGHGHGHADMPNSGGGIWE